MVFKLHSFGSEDDKRLVPTCSRHSFWSVDDERLVPPAVHTRSGGSRRSQGSPPRVVPLVPRTDGDLVAETASAHRLSALFLVPTGCWHLFWSEDDERLVPTGCWHLFWSEDDKRLVPPGCWHLFGRLAPPRTVRPNRLSAFVLE